MKIENTKAVRISSRLYEGLRTLSKEQGREIKYLINRAVENYLKITLFNRLQKPKK